MDEHEIFKDLVMPSSVQLDKVRSKLQQMGDHFTQDSRCKHIALVTSGGTQVPLEKNQVRFIENFSTGRRGAASAECFLKDNYYVIYLHRQGCIYPFTRHLLNQSDGVEVFMESLDITSDSEEIILKPKCKSQAIQNLIDYKYFTTKNQFVSIPFVTLDEYLYLLKETCLFLQRFGKNSLLYLCAAVSDFHLPYDALYDQKIPSSQPLYLKLNCVPKILRFVTKNWCPNAYVVTFKLETDKSIVIEKAKNALLTYKHQAVVANNLQEIRTKVTIIENNYKLHDITVLSQDVIKGNELEYKIVKEISQMHFDFLCNT